MALQIGVKSDHLATAWAFKIVATAMRAEQVAFFWGQSESTSICLIKLCENTKSSVLQWENSHFLPAMHSTLEPNSQTCGAKVHCEPPSHLTPRLWVRPVPSSKPFKTVYREHTAGPWLIQCDEILQKSVDFNRSLLFNLGRGVFVASFWSPTGSSAPCVCLKRWNH